MVPKIEPRTKFSSWLLKYRFMIIIILVVAVIPAILITTFYITEYQKYKKVDFGDGQFITEFNDMGFSVEDNANAHQLLVIEKNDFIVYIKLTRIVEPQFDNDDQAQYYFRVKYAKKNNMTVESLKLTLLLQTEWMGIKSPASVDFSSINTAWSAERGVKMPYTFPQKPSAWFVTVDSPLLYAKLTYTLVTGMNTSTPYTDFYQGQVGKITPSNVLDDLAKE